MISQRATRAAPTARRFHAFKVAVNGSREKWGYVSNLTHAEARCGVRFPYGVHEDPNGRYSWSYALMWKYC